MGNLFPKKIVPEKNLRNLFPEKISREKVTQKKLSQEKIVTQTVCDKKKVSRSRGGGGGRMEGEMDGGEGSEGSW